MLVRTVFIPVVLVLVGEASSESCGRAAGADSGWRIVSGEKSTFNQWPWVVNLMTDGYVCGGSVIDPWTIVSAAHCGTRAQYNPSKMRITIGHTKYSGIPFHHYYFAKKIILHSHYHPNRLAAPFDVMVVKLDRPVFDVEPICLPEKKAKFTKSSNCFVAGWGKTELGYTSSYLKHTKVPIISNRQCRKQGALGTRVFDTHICAGGLGTNACGGDSGGPLMCQRADSGEWVLAGVVSFGAKECEADGRPTVFTRISEFRSWIDEQIS